VSSPAPVAKRVTHREIRHGHEFVDDYAWLIDRDDPDTLAYLKAENDYAEAALEALAPLREAIFQDIKARTVETDLSVPVRWGPWSYYSRTVEGLDYAIRCRRPVATDGSEGDEQVVLDENAEAVGREFFSLGVYELSPSHRLVAWSHDATGSEEYELHVRDLGSGADRIVATRTAAAAAWATDERVLFYLVQDEAMRPHQVWRRQLDTDDEPVLVFEEHDERFFVDLDRSRDGSFVVVTSSSKTSSEVRLVPGATPLAEAIVVEPRRPGIEYEVEPDGDRILVLTNEDAEDFKVVTAPADAPGRINWRELVPHQAGLRISSVDAFAGHVVLHEWADAVPRVRVLFGDGHEQILGFDEESYDIELGANPEYEATTLRYEYQSLVTPPSVYDEDLVTGARVLRKRTPVEGGFDPAHYVTARAWATASDGARVPIDLVRHRDTAVDGTAAVCVYAYGSYEVSVPPWFSIPRLSLLDRGMVFALVHPRGGGELGRGWYLGGKLHNKRNTFTDTIAAAEHVVAAGWGKAGRLALRGGSAGGLLVGACINLRPDLFAAALAEVPFVDVVSTMLDPSLPLTITEREEWGDPNLADDAAYIGSYSPYDNVAAVDHPALLVTAGLNDPRVSYHEPAKWVAKLRAVAPGTRPLYLLTELSAGHHGRSGRYDRWRDEARNLAFLLTHTS
jgi:oligopeptidase B